jgi:TolB-like protein
MRSLRGSGFLLLMLLPISLPYSLESQEPLTLEEGIREIATTLGERMSTGEIRKIAVVEFSDLAGYESALGLFVAEELTTRLLEANPGAFDVVERQQLIKVLNEQNLTASALFDSETIANVGEILGIEAIVTGTIADLGEEVKIHARSISVSTAKIFAAADTRVPKKGVVDSLMHQGTAPNLRGSAALPAAPGRPVQASDVFFQNAFLRLMVDSLGIAEDQEYATLALRMENLTAEDLLLAVELVSQSCQIRLVDNQGVQLKPASSYQKGVSGIACFDFPRPDRVNPEAFSILSAKSRSTLVVRLEVEGRDQKATGTHFSVGVNFLRLKDGKVSRFTAGVSNIEPN